jgi:hypothetical protein
MSTTPRRANPVTQVTTSALGNIVENNSTPNSEDNSVTTSDVTSENPTPVVEEKPIDLSPGMMDETLYLALRDQLSAAVNEHNSLAEGIKAAGDRVALKDSLLEKPEQTNDTEFVSLVTRRNELSDALEAAEKEISEKAEPFIQNHLKRSGVEEKQNKADEIAKQAKATINFLGAMNASLDGIPALANRSGRNTSTSDGRGSGVKKYRNLEVYVDGRIADQKVTVKKADGTTENVRKSNLTYGASAANVPNDVFREAFVKAQGTDDAANFKERVVFDVTDGTGKVHSVIVKKIAD